MKTTQELPRSLQEILEHQERMMRSRREAWLRSLERSKPTPQKFLETEDAVCFDPAGKISSQKLYALYVHWCEEQGREPEKPRTFFLYVKNNAERYQLHYTGCIRGEDGKRVRGFRGIRMPEGNG